MTSNEVGSIMRRVPERYIIFETAEGTQFKFNKLEVEGMERLEDYIDGTFYFVFLFSKFSDSFVL